MGRVWKIIFALILGVAVTLVTGLIQSSQSDLLCVSPLGTCQATKSYGFPLSWRKVVSYVYPPDCTGPLERACILQLYYPPQRYDLISFLLDAIFFATLDYGLILSAGWSYRHLLTRFPLRVSREKKGNGQRMFEASRDLRVV